MAMDTPTAMSTIIDGKEAISRSMSHLMGKVNLLRLCIMHYRPIMVPYMRTGLYPSGWARSEKPSRPVFESSLGRIMVISSFFLMKCLGFLPVGPFL
jgi:hypothetical protein